MNIGENMMQVLIVVGIIIAAAAVIPLSVKYLGANNPVEEAAETIIKDELPNAEAEVPAAITAIEALGAAPAKTPVANAPAAQ